MKDFPVEILTVIFSHLPQSELLSLTRVCKKFNGIINKSGLIKRIFLSENSDSSLPPTRKYTEASVKRFLPDIFEYTGVNLKMVQLSHCSLKLVEILRIFQLATNVTNVSFSYVQLADDKIDGSSELPQLNNVELLFEESDPRIFDIFKKTSFTKIDLRFFADVPYSNFVPLVNMLSTQEKLTSIAFSGIYESNLFLVPMGKSNYRLKEFYVDNCDLEEWDELERYLAGHVETMEKITIKSLRWDPSTTLNHCKNLKSFEVKNTELNFLGNLNSVQRLSVEPPVRTMEVFPNVRRLLLGRSSLQANQVASATMGNIEDLEIKFGELSGISMPTLKTLKLSSISGTIANEFFTLHNKIEDLTFLHTFDINDSLLEALTTALTNLKVLRIIGDNHLTSRAFTIIKENCKNLETFEMAYWSQKFKKDDWKILDEIVGLKVYTEDF